MMNDLARLAIAAHGGLDTWRQFSRVTARLVNGGALWHLKGVPGVLDDVHVTADLRRPWASHAPFRQPDLRTAFTPDRVAIERIDGTVIEERRDPRAAFAGHTLETPWDDLHLAYFAGYAMWTYLTTPFVLAWPGVTSDEVAPWQEDARTEWRRLRVTFPETIATHSREQTFYFDREGLLQRQDYAVDVMGGTTAAHYVSRHETIAGIVVPTRRLVYPPLADNRPDQALLVVSIDLSDIAFT